jgi:hypothetical protein
MSANAFKAHRAAESSRKREKRSKTVKATSIPTNDHTGREEILKRLREKQSK